jgi:hypothetical protein
MKEEGRSARERRGTGRARHGYQRQMRFVKGRIRAMKGYFYVDGKIRH